LREFHNADPHDLKTKVFGNEDPRLGCTGPEEKERLVFQAIVDVTTARNPFVFVPATNPPTAGAIRAVAAARSKTTTSRRCLFAIAPAASAQ
jgi:hypothetical protein